MFYEYFTRVVCNYLDLEAIIPCGGRMDFSDASSTFTKRAPKKSPIHQDGSGRVGNCWHLK